MRIALISPAGAMHRYRGSFSRSLHYAPLTLTTLASLIPPELDADVVILDETVGPIPPDLDADIVGITVITGTSPRAYRWGDHFMQRGMKVVLGGIHPTLMPQEAARHADAVVVGFAEETWPRLLRDFAAGSLQSLYVMDRDIDLSGRPLPRRDLLRRSDYITLNTVEAVRGCLHSCGFCAVPAALGNRLYKRPAREVIEEIERLPGKEVAFVDVNLISDPQYAKELFTQLRPLRKWWFGLATVNIGKDDELLRLAARSGCKGLLIGFESISPSALDYMSKPFHQVNGYRELIDRLHDHGIAVNGTFAFGGDGEDRDIFKKTVDMVLKLKVDLPRYALLTPFPGTPLFARLCKEDRIIERDWALYDVEHCVFRPLKMTPDELEEGLEWAWRQTYSLTSIARRLTSPGTLFWLSALLNLGYRRYAVKLPGFNRRVMSDNSDVPN